MITPFYGDLNHLIYCTMSGVTYLTCFSGELNSDIRRIANNLTWILNLTLLCLYLNLLNLI